jgi:protein-L-isoaspartate(D-aspartate) O-methyltransferase
MASDVYSMERIAKLLDRARANLRPLKIPNIRLKHGDGNLGLPQAAPFDTIILAAAAPAVPQELLKQLAPGGRMVMPLGSSNQVILLIEHGQTGGFKETRLDAVRFVPLLPGTE